MRSREWMNKLVSAAGFAALLAVSCQDSTGSRFVTVQVSLARADAAANVALAPQDVTAGRVDIGDVDAFTATLDSVQLATSGSQGWQTVQPTGAVTMNLLDLSTSTTLVLGTVTLVPGPCQARLFVSNATISFNTAITVGQDTFDPIPITHPATIPSGPQTGLKAGGGCTVGTTDVTLAFDAVATVGTIVATGHGIMLTPVIRVVQP